MAHGLHFALQAPGRVRLMASSLNPITVQLMGRRGSDAALPYIAESPLDIEGFADTVRGKGLGACRLNNDEAVARAVS